MTWKVEITKKAAKSLVILPEQIKVRLSFLVKDLAQGGPVRGNWPNYGKLEQHKHHCHIKKGKPCYVVVWIEKQDGIQIIEVQYVGTHENAPY